MQAILRRLLDRLDAIAEEHEEVGDTDIREAMSAAVFDGVLRPVPGVELPDRYAMVSDYGDRLVLQALAEFLPAANQYVAEARLASFHQRLSAFQDGDLQSAAGSYYDDDFGWANPK